jgi:two-component system chemotaxis response regulator CheY
MTKKILVVDDSREARQQVKTTLSDSGYEVIEAVDGRDGLLKMTAHADTCLVLCDINMPIMNGLEMLARLRTEQPSTQVPFVVLTTEALPDMLERARDAGATGWILKPIEPPTLLAAVRRLAGDAPVTRSGTRPSVRR